MQKNPLYNTSSISFFQYLFAIAVILVHSGRLTSYEPLHFGLKSMLGRLAVPFFYRLCQLFPQTIPREFSENEGLSGQNRKNLFVLEFCLPPLCLALFL